jgi:cytochrome b6-f complex iron-sulfur subunit
MADRPRDSADELKTADGLDRYVEALMDGTRPSPDDARTPEASGAARVAAELAAATGAGANPDPAFIDQLRLRMRQADAGIAAVRSRSLPRPGAEPAAADASLDGSRLARVRITRRALLQGGIGAAAGLAAGALGYAVLRGQSPAEPGLLGGTGGSLVAGPGAWEAVSTVASLPPGSAQRFTTAAFDGYVVNDGGQIRALSSVCTHMGCTLYYRPASHDLRCPCHGASFDLTGHLANGPDRWSSGGTYASEGAAYPVSLPPLVRPEVKVENGTIYVWTARV